MQDRLEDMTHLRNTPLGSLREELEDNDIQLDREFLRSFITGIAGLALIGIGIVVPVLIYGTLAGY